ncbi:transcriptional regulator GcvA [Inquilinus limosus]|uniref:transcriptional regulator GcvA n=1 Tax=Inquilinus limosus TaxID=171674 RepID=UPI000692538F|nr:transcriptional regulator GcvA [Inquilinus limosus]
MAWRLPPLNALRAFEAAGRYVSFTRAAEELHVTPGAISRQIKLLEDFLGVELFDRTHRDLRMTDASRAYVGALTDVFERADNATKRLLNAHRERSLRIQSAMTFTLRWLMPRLPLFHKMYPTRELHLTTMLAPLPTHYLVTGEVDVAIQQGRGDWDGVISHRLAGSELIPVCSPALLRADPPLREYNDLSRHTLLHSLARPDDWQDWLAAAGATDVDPARGLRFESSSLAYQAAIEGIGIAIGQMALVIEDLETGRLVPAFDFILQNGNAYHLMYYEHAAKNPRLVEFRDWILGEAARYEASHRFPGAKTVHASPAPAATSTTPSAASAATSAAE